MANIKQKKNPIYADISVTEFRLQNTIGDPTVGDSIDNVEAEANIDLLLSEHGYLVRGVFKLQIKMILPKELRNEQVSCYIRIDHIFDMKNLKSAIKKRRGAEPDLESNLEKEIIYLIENTSRGIIHQKLIGTPFQGFILPIK